MTITADLLIFAEHLPAQTCAPAIPPNEGLLRLILPFEHRQKARQRARLAAGFEIGIQLPRGTVLRGGDRLRATDGTLLEIVAAAEAVSTVWSHDLQHLARVAYHLGNRHVALEVGVGWVRYLADHVLDGMVTQLGLTVVHETQPFEPESGAYEHGAGQVHAHAHRHRHNPLATHVQAHNHDHHDHHDHHESHEHRVIFGGLHRPDHRHEQ